jgi:lysyl-tRNA synthetase class 2
LGDIVGVEGYLYRTQKGELSIRVTHIRMLTKSLLPLPDKHHGLTDQEARYRQRYIDLMTNPASMNVFKMRSKIVSKIRSYMELNSFTEVETPMMHPIPGGASAKPFITHHNALDIGLYLRIAPELYLKRLIVGGFTKVFEINRNFRNEGLSPRHNPEFTMMEFYWAYADYNDLMDFTEKLLADVASVVAQDIIFDGVKIDLSKKFDRMTMREAVLLHYDEKEVALTQEALSNDEEAVRWWQSLVAHGMDESCKSDVSSAGELTAFLFEEYVEHKLVQPTFITEFPIEISPLARRNNHNPAVADRFELFIARQEIANGFSELNDPDDQEQRFRDQVDAMSRGDEEAMHYDADYIKALQYGMAPTAGEGIGIDRLVTILLNQSNIRDVLLFPQMKPKNN